MGYEARIDKALQKIADVSGRLDETLDRLEEDGGGKVGHFLGRQKAVLEIRSVVREVGKIERYREMGRVAAGVRMEPEREKAVREGIERAYADLDGALERLGEGGAGIRGFVEQHRMVYLIRKILNDEGRYDAEEELGKFAIS